MKSSVSPPAPARGRPRSDRAHRTILQSTLKELGRTGFRLLTIDAISEHAGVGKTTIYRRWPNKAAVVMDAFMTLVGPGTGFPAAPQALERIRLQMRLQAKFFRGRFGHMIRTLLGEAQFDPELAQAFRELWIRPRREGPRLQLEEAIRQGDLRPDIDIEAAIDSLYGPLYYRLQIGTGPVSDAFAETIFRQTIAGLAVISASAGSRGPGSRG